MTTSNITPLLFEGEHLVRMVERDGNPWWVGADAAKVLEYRNASDALRIVPDDEKDTHQVRTPGGDQEVLVISEPGLYRLIFRSNKPVAERFQRWVFHDVLPSIRKSGSYGEEKPARLTPPASEIPELDEPVAVRKSLVTEARHTFGSQAAREVWFRLGLVVTPAMLAAPNQWDLFHYTAIKKDEPEAGKEAA